MTIFGDRILVDWGVSGVAPVSFSATIIGASSTAAIDLDSGRTLSGSLTAASNTSAIDLLTLFAFSASIIGASSTTGIDIVKTLAFAAAIVGASSTTVIDMLVPVEGTVAFGHDTGVTEQWAYNFSGLWTATGGAKILGSGDAEKMTLATGEVLELIDPWNLGSGNAIFDLNKYLGVASLSISVSYRSGATPGECEAASYSPYIGAFSSLGYVGVKLEY